MVVSASAIPSLCHSSCFLLTLVPLGRFGDHGVTVCCAALDKARVSGTSASEYPDETVETYFCFPPPLPPWSLDFWRNYSGNVKVETGTKIFPFAIEGKNSDDGILDAVLHSVSPGTTTPKQDLSPSQMARPKLYHSAAERRAANAVHNQKHHEKHRAKRNQIRRERHQENLLRQAAQTAQREKRERLAAKKRRAKAEASRVADAQAQSHPDEALTTSDARSETLTMSTASTVLEQLQNFTCRNPRRFLQAVVTDYIATQHRPSLFATVAELQAIIAKSQNLGKDSIEKDKGKQSLLLVSSWANEIRIEVTRSYHFTVKRYDSKKFLFQQAHSNDDLGFTVAED
ncbi:hypothetical protein C8J56DRAFT_886055 [Mycena floridula]|nr:hypothetical protein C8J56DRAFT_886055 [Mycena floridula]